MKFNIKYLPLLLIGSLYTSTHARVHNYGADIEDVWEDMDMLMRENFNQMSRMAKQFNQLTMDDEDTTFSKHETVQLPNVTSQVSQDDNNVILKISIEAPDTSKSVSDKKDTMSKENKKNAKVDKKQEIKKENYLLKKDKIEITPDDNKLEVNIPLANSYVKVYIDKNHYSIIKGSSSKKEQKEKNVTSFSSSSFEKLVKSDYLPPVNIADGEKNIKAKVDEKSNTLTITIAKKKTTKINVE